MSFEISDLKEAYSRLKSYVYYDNTDIVLRRQLVEFETNTTKDFNSIFKSSPEPYKKKVDIFNFGVPQSIESKLEAITEHLNNYNNSKDFFDYFLDKININFYPKKYQEDITTDNFISNKRIKKEYPIERLTAFIDAPIELHIISVLWIIKYGVSLDSQLDESCVGNRLLLNKDKKKLVHGSGLFKPYFKQYQKWRDSSVNEAQQLLKNNKDVLFLNLDVKDYFHSVRISNDIIFKGRKYKGDIYNAYYNLEEILLKIHHIYTEKISSEYQLPYNFNKELKRNNDGELSEFVLPIGLMSSYVLANHYLKEFDKRIVERYKPAYYGRYVDDILLVIADPNPYSNQDEVNEDFKFSFSKYKAAINRKKKVAEKVSFKEKDLNKLEEYILTNLSPLINLVDSPFDKNHNIPAGRAFKINGYSSLFCQSEKSLLYYFDSQESDLVINKLKKELEDRTSEFRDMPNHDNALNDFENNAYHLHYSGTEGKIRTLKDYKENRYGLTLYLSNQIFSSLRHERKISSQEKNQILKFFKGENSIKFYRLWERIFTFFIINEEAQAYVDFYIHCAEQIDKINYSKNKYIKGTKVDYSQVRDSLVEYLDCAHELALSLNPGFIRKTKAIEQNFEFQTSELINSSLSYFLGRFEPTKSNSFWLDRFRETNMIRHQYVTTPLLNFTKNTRRSNLLDLNFNIDNYELDEELIKNSPRPLKYWECCLASAFEHISNYKRDNNKTNNEYRKTNILGPFITKTKDPITENDVIEENYYLDKAFDIYLEGNEKHLPHYIINDSNLKNEFFLLENRNKDIEKSLQLKEFRVNSYDKIQHPTISFANTEVKEDNIINSLRKNPNLSIQRYQKLASILRQARKENSDILLFPEFFVPINLLSSLVSYSVKNQSLIITGLEHLTIDKTAFNFVVTVLPVEVNGIKDATVVFRLKNHYAPVEEDFIYDDHLSVPKPNPYRYDLFNWRNIYFSVFYCFELANIEHRSLLRSKIDLLVALEWNKDTPYFSNIVESSSRDLHSYIAQVNTSQYGDTRLTQPTETSRKDLLRLKGGINDSILVAKLDIPKLREFQRKKFSKTNKNFKPLPPDFSFQDVIKRINNKKML